MRKMLIGVMALALLTAACKAEVNLGLEVNADGSGTIVLETGFDEEFIELVFAGEDPGDAVFGPEALGELSPDAEVQIRTEGEFTYYAASVPFDSVDDLDQLSEGENPFGSLTITATEEEVRVEAQLDEGAGGILGDAGGITGDDLGGLGGDEFDEEFGADLLEDVFSAHVRVVMPGEVTESNADRTLSDGTLEWDIPLSLEATEFTVVAASDPNPSGSSGFPWWAIIVGIVVIGAIALVVLARRGSSQKAADTPEPAPVAAVPPVAPAPAAPVTPGDAAPLTDAAAAEQWAEPADETVTAATDAAAPAVTDAAPATDVDPTPDAADEAVAAADTAAGAITDAAPAAPADTPTEPAPAASQPADAASTEAPAGDDQEDSGEPTTTV